MHYIVYDLEATCWPGRPDFMQQEIIEIGAIKLDGYGEVIGSFNRFVKPVVHPLLSPFCKELTTIEQSDVDRAAEFGDVVHDFQDWTGLFDDVHCVFCSWGSFDKKQLELDCRFHDVEDDWVHPHVNVKRQYQEFKRLRRPVGLRKAVEKEGFTFTGAHHRGIDDAENLAKLFRKYLDEWRF